MDRELWFLLVGAGISLVSSIIGALVQHKLSFIKMKEEYKLALRADRIKMAREYELAFRTDAIRRKEEEENEIREQLLSSGVKGLPSGLPGEKLITAIIESIGKAMIEGAGKAVGAGE